MWPSTPEKALSPFSCENVLFYITFYIPPPCPAEPCLSGYIEHCTLEDGLKTFWNKHPTLFHSILLSIFEYKSEANISTFYRFYKNTSFIWGIKFQRGFIFCLDLRNKTFVTSYVFHAMGQTRLFTGRATIINISAKSGNCPYSRSDNGEFITRFLNWTWKDAIFV